MNFNKRAVVLPFATILSLLIGGCADEGLEKVVVQGEVTFDGKPVPNGQIRFIPKQDTAGPVSGGVIKDGQYTARGKGGVPLGKHRVEIYAYRPIGNVANGAVAAEGAPSEQYLPAEYNGASTLEVEVTGDSSSNPINFELQP